MTDHRAEAVRLVKRGENAGPVELMLAYARLAEVHVKLACAPVEPSNWPPSGPPDPLLRDANARFDELRDAVRDYVDNIGDDEVEGAPRFARLRALVGGPS